MEPEGDRHHPRKSPTRRHSRRHVCHRLLLVHGSIRIHPTSLVQREGDSCSGKCGVCRLKQRDPLPQKYRHSSHNRRQLLRYRLEWQPVRQDDRLDEGTLLADTACNTPTRNPVTAVNILHMDRRSLHVPVRERLHSHTCYIAQQPVLIHDPTLDKKSSKPTPIFKTLADIQIAGPEAIL